jgi:hypothetical protein
MGPICFLVGVLAAGVSLVFFVPLCSRKNRVASVCLIQLVPAAPHGWTREFLPLGKSPESSSIIASVLNYDDAFFVEYKKGGSRLSLYFAYWRYGKMPHRLVASHSPDVCWPAAGWTCYEWPDYVLETFLAGAERRKMLRDGKSEYMVFWHFVGGMPTQFKSLADSWRAIPGHILARGLKQCDEQYFIRMSSPDPMFIPEHCNMIRELLERIPLSKAGSVTGHMPGLSARLE